MFGKKELRPLQKERLESLVLTCLKSSDINKAEKSYYTASSILYYLCQKRNYFTVDYDNMIMEKILPYIKGLREGDKLK